MKPRFDDVYIFQMGFTQKLNKRPGMLRCWERQRQFAGRGRLICTPKEWNADWKAFGDFIAEYTHGGTRIYTCSYSWGAGWGFVRLAKRLQLCSRLIQHAILIDPVYRSTVLPSWLPLNPISMTKLGKIHVPNNVREVTYFLQRQNRPAGRELSVDPEFTKVNGPTMIKTKHESMDDHLEVLDAVINVFTPDEFKMGMGSGL